jgi:hypothetical protein
MEKVEVRLLELQVQESKAAIDVFVKGNPCLYNGTLYVISNKVQCAFAEWPFLLTASKLILFTFALLYCMCND